MCFESLMMNKLDNKETATVTLLFLKRNKRVTDQKLTANYEM